MINDQKKWHKSITTDRLMALVHERNTTLSDPGVCLACGEGKGGCEPDARAYECEHCGEEQVYAPEELLMEIF